MINTVVFKKHNVNRDEMFRVTEKWWSRDENLMKSYEIQWNLMKTTEIHWNLRKSIEIQRNLMKPNEFHTKITRNHQILVMKSLKFGDEIRSNPINSMIGGANRYSWHMYALTDSLRPVVLIHTHCICMRTQAAPISD